MLLFTVKPTDGDHVTCKKDIFNNCLSNTDSTEVKNNKSGYEEEINFI